MYNPPSRYVGIPPAGIQIIGLPISYLLSVVSGIVNFLSDGMGVSPPWRY